MPGQLQLGVHGRDWVFEFVGNVGDKAPLQAERPFHAVQHIVECTDQVGQLIPVVVVLYPFAQIIREDSVHFAHDMRNRGQRLACKEPTTGRNGGDNE